MLLLGQQNTLKVNRQKEQGLYLADEQGNEVLLPTKYIPENTKIDDELQVFVYKDGENRLVATTLEPLLLLGEYAALEAVVSNNTGAFFNWGLEKDLFVPHSQQIEEIEVGFYYVVYLYHDKVSDRLVGTTRIENTLEKNEIDVNVGDQVTLMAYDENEIGYKVIVNGAFQGMLYKNEVFTEIQVGDKLTGFVKKVREDNKIDVSLNKFGYRAVDANVKKLHKVLEENNGYIRLTDKSSPEEIYKMLGMSKKLFKKAVGALFKAEQIEIRSTGIKLK